MTNDAFARLEVDARLVAQGWDVLNAKATQCVVLNFDLQVKSPANEQGRL